MPGPDTPVESGLNQAGEYDNGQVEIVQIEPRRDK
jgi:hypothetical protein